MPAKLRLVPVWIGVALYAGDVLMVYGRLLAGGKGDVWGMKCKEGIAVNPGDVCRGCPDMVMGSLPVSIITGCAQAAVVALHAALIVLFPPNQPAHVLIGVIGVLCLIAAACEVIFLHHEIDKKCDFGTAIYTPHTHTFYSLLIIPPIFAVLTITPFFLRGGVEVVDANDEEMIVVKVWKERGSITKREDSEAASHATGGDEQRPVPAAVWEEAKEVVCVLSAALLSLQCVANIVAASDYWEIPFITRILVSRDRPIPFLPYQKKVMIDAMAASAREEHRLHPQATPQTPLELIVSPPPLALAMDPDLPSLDLNPLSTPNQSEIEPPASSGRSKRNKKKKRRRKDKR
eukprot:TRINITY_DN33272_c0_g1_i1.p1 TRINITY_DN33272_c0_g1~~TRINITY_DN33272_c0_g1_i1.p1  ORF type:complete len:347 (+),score=35.86 TRINITY_DN33272_c0_g1_i1:52-1092(+)